ncbi:membrane hypothetical protein [Vibrio chagasii]|nr:membrane hypothetical protein [Vibrio chagasii]
MHHFLNKISIQSRFLLLFLVGILCYSSEVEANTQYWKAKQETFDACLDNLFNDDNQDESDYVSIDQEDILTACLVIEPAPDLFIESIVMLLPKTSTSLINPIENDDANSIVSGLFRGLILSINNKIGDFPSLTFGRGGEERVTPLDPYINPSNIFHTETGMYKYKQNVLGIGAWGIKLEDGLTWFLRTIGMLGITIFSVIYLRRLMIMGFDGSGGKEILITSIKELPPLMVSIALIAPPESGGLPLIGYVLVGSVITAALIASGVTVLITPAIYVSFGSGDINLTTLSPFEEQQDIVTSDFENSIDSMSTNIVLSDILAAHFLRDNKVNLKEGSEDILAAAKKGRPVGCFNQPRWHLKVFTDPECLGFKNYVSEILTQDDINTSRVIRQSEVNGYLASAHEKSGNDLGGALYNEITANAYIDKAYKAALDKRESICQSTPSLANSRMYSREWFCTSYNHVTGEYSGSPINSSYYEELSSKGSKNSLESNMELTSKYHNASKANIDDVFLIGKLLSSGDINITEVKNKLKKNIDVTEFISRGIFNNIWNAISLGNSISLALGELSMNQFASHSNYLIDISNLVPVTKVDINELADTDLYSSFYTEHQQLIDEFMDFENELDFEDKREDLDGMNLDWLLGKLLNITPSQCTSNSNMCVDFTNNPISSLGSKVNIMLGLSFVITVGVTIIEEIYMSKIHLAEFLFSALKSISNLLLFVSLNFVAFTMLPFLTYFLYASLKIFVRFIVYVLASPIVIISFIVKKNTDKEFDDNSIFIPKEILGMSLRLAVDFFAISITMILGMMFVYINISVFTLIVSYLMIGMGSDDSVLSVGFIEYLIKMVIMFVLITAGYIYSIYKAATLQPYIHDKLTEFAYTGFRLNTDKDNEAEMIIGILEPVVGIISGKR